MNGKRNMSCLLNMSFLLIAGAIIGVTSSAGASTQSNPGGADSSNITLGEPNMLFGGIEKVEDEGFVIQSDVGQFMKLQLSKHTNIVCSNPSHSKLIPISPPTAVDAQLDASDCRFKPGDLVRIESADAGRMTTVTRLPYEEEEDGSQIATEKEEESSTSIQ